MADCNNGGHEGLICRIVLDIEVVAGPARGFEVEHVTGGLHGHEGEVEFSADEDTTAGIEDGRRVEVVVVLPPGQGSPDGLSKSYRFAALVVEETIGLRKSCQSLVVHTLHNVVKNVKIDIEKKICGGEPHRRRRKGGCSETSGCHNL